MLNNSIYVIPPKNIGGNNKKIDRKEEFSRKKMEYHMTFFPKNKYIKSIIK